MSERPRRGKLDREPDPEKHPELGPELSALYAAWLDAVKEFRVYRCDIADRADVEANPDTVFVQIDADNVHGRTVIDNMISDDEHRVILRWMLESFDQSFAAEYTSDGASDLSGAKATPGSVTRWDLTEMRYVMEGGQREKKTFVPEFRKDGKTDVAKTVLKLNVKRFHEIMRIISSGDARVRVMSDAPREPRAEAHKKAILYDKACGSHLEYTERLVELNKDLEQSFGEDDKFALQGTTYWFD